MCGRFALFSDPLSIASSLKLALHDVAWQPRYNVVPGNWITGVRRRDDESSPEFDNLWWGFRPHWAGGDAPKPINARAENLDSSKYFRGAFHHHRCLIPADGWYEWMPTASGKQPYFFTREDRQPLFLASIWESFEDGSACCAIITEPARGVAKDVHDRMPLILSGDSYEAWLDPGLVDREGIRASAHHLTADALTMWPVSRRVNRASEEGAELVAPVAL